MSCAQEKICSSCKEPKTPEEFGKNKTQPDGYNYTCKLCIKKRTASRKEKNKEYYKQWSQSNKVQLTEYHKKYRKKNREKLNEYQRDRPVEKKKKYNSSEKKKRREKERRQEPSHKKQRRVKEKTKYWNDVQFRRKKQLEGRLRVLFIKNDTTIKSINLIGCTIPEFKARLEAMFLPTMTWDNYGVDWDFSHIKPFSGFDLTNLEEQKKCLHFTNVLPLFKTTRIIDGIEYVGNLNKDRFLE